MPTNKPNPLADVSTEKLLEIWGGQVENAKPVQTPQEKTHTPDLIDNLMGTLSDAGTFARSVAEGATVGISEPAVSAAKAGARSFLEGVPFKKAYEEDVAQRTEEKKKSPKLDIGGQVVGSLLPMTPAALVARGAGALGKAVFSGSKLLPTIGRGAIAGATMGGATEGAKQFIGGESGFSQGGADYSGVVPAMALGGGMGAATGAIGEGIQAGARRFVEKPGAADIRAAGATLGVEPTPGQVMNSEFVGKLEYNLGQSPYPGTGGVKSLIKSSYRGTKDAAHELLNEASAFSHFEVGSKVKGEILNEIEQRIQPAADIYNDLSMALKETAAETGNLRKAIAKLQEHAAVDGSGEINGILKSNLAALENVKTVDQLKTFRTSLNNQLANRNATPTQQFAVDALYDAATLDRRTALINNSRAAGFDPAQTSKRLEEADALYAATMNDFAQSLNIKKTSTPGVIKAQVSDIPEENVTKTLFNTAKIKELEGLKKTFPDQYESMRQSRIADILEKSTVSGDVSPSAFIRNVSKMEPETRNLVFGKDSNAKIDAIKKMLDAFSKVKDPGTAAQIEWNSIFDIGSTATAMGKSALYNALTLPSRTGAIGSLLKKPVSVLAIPDNSFTRRLQKKEGK